MGEYRSTRGEKPPKTETEKKRTAWRIWLKIAVGAAVLAVALAIVRIPRYIPASGYATTYPYSEVRSPVSGVIASIEAFSGDTVEKGDVLVRLNDEIEKSVLEKAVLEEKRTASELEYKRFSLAEAQRVHSNELHLAALALDYAKKRLGITRQLVEKGLASSRDLMYDEHQVEMSALKYGQLEGRDFAREHKETEMLMRSLEAAAAAVGRAKADLESRTIRAPSPGLLFRHTFYVGEVARPDQVLFEIFGNEQKLLRLRVPEKYSTRIPPSSRVRAQFRTDRKLVFKNWVSAKVGDMRGVIQSEGNETYRVVYCPYGDGGVEIPPGTGADAEIFAGRVPLWKVVFGVWD